MLASLSVEVGFEGAGVSDALLAMRAPEVTRGLVAEPLTARVTAVRCVSRGRVHRSPLIASACEEEVPP